MKNLSKTFNKARKLLIATTNPGKLLEYKILLKDLPLKLVSLKDLNVEAEAEEKGETYEENAIEKVKFYSRLTKLPTLADDAGIEVDYLDGEPGVKSRFWFGYRATDKELIDIILAKLKGVPRGKRGAQLRMVIALFVPGQEKIYTFKGSLRGIIVEKPTKTFPGYPFRAVFYVPKIKKVLGELTMEEEAAIAHRKKAIEKALPILKNLC